jgi:hypothetical protein
LTPRDTFMSNKKEGNYMVDDKERKALGGASAIVVIPD